MCPKFAVAVWLLTALVQCWSGRGLHSTHQDAAAAHGRLGSQQVLPHVVEQRGGGDLEAVRVGAIGEWTEGLSWFQGQDLRQRDLLAGPEDSRGLQVHSVLTTLT